MFKKILLPIAIVASLLPVAIVNADPVFLLAQTKVTNTDAFFGKYGPAAFASLQKHGATVYFGAQDYTAIEGEWSGNWTALISFASEDEALAWYNSDDYKEKARPIRLKSSEGGKLILFRPASGE